MIQDIRRFRSNALDGLPLDRPSELVEALERFRGTRTYRAKERLVAMSRTNPLARFGLAVYRRLRGKSSRST